MKNGVFLAFLMEERVESVASSGLSVFGEDNFIRLHNTDNRNPDTEDSEKTNFELYWAT